jgi:hypothetical protein
MLSKVEGSPLISRQAKKGVQVASDQPNFFSVSSQYGRRLLSFYVLSHSQASRS